MRESPQNPLNSGLGIIVICPDPINQPQNNPKLMALKALHQHEGAALCRGLNRWELCVRDSQDSVEPELGTENGATGRVEAPQKV